MRFVPSATCLPPQHSGSCGLTLAAGSREGAAVVAVDDSSGTSDGGAAMQLLTTCSADATICTVAFNSTNESQVIMLSAAAHTLPRQPSNPHPVPLLPPPEQACVHPHTFSLRCTFCSCPAPTSGSWLRKAELGGVAAHSSTAMPGRWLDSSVPTTIRRVKGASVARCSTSSALSVISWNQLWRRRGSKCKGTRLGRVTAGRQMRMQTVHVSNVC